VLNEIFKKKNGGPASPFRVSVPESISCIGTIRTTDKDGEKLSILTEDGSVVRFEVERTADYNDEGDAEFRLLMRKEGTDSDVTYVLAVGTAPDMHAVKTELETTYEGNVRKRPLTMLAASTALVAAFAALTAVAVVTSAPSIQTVPPVDTFPKAACSGPTEAGNGCAAALPVTGKINVGGQVDNLTSALPAPGQPEAVAPALQSPAKAEEKAGEIKTEEKPVEASPQSVSVDPNQPLPKIEEIKPVQVNPAPAQRSEQPVDPSQPLPTDKKSEVAPVNGEAAQASGVPSTLATRIEQVKTEQAQAKPADLTALNGGKEMKIEQAGAALAAMDDIRNTLNKGGLVTEEQMAKLPPGVADKLRNSGIMTIGRNKEVAESIQTGGQARINPAKQLPEEAIEASKNRYGIPSLPSRDTWTAMGGNIRLPLPGGGDVKTPEDMKQFGLQP
jgi:hypothetical protein